MTHLQLDLESAAILKNKEQWLEKAAQQLSHIQQGECQGKEWLGWYAYPKREGFQLLERIESFCGEYKVFYDCVIVIGIGGSFAGTKAISHALGGAYLHELKALGDETRQLPIYYLGHNLSEGEITDLFTLLKYKSPVVTVISKSGTTTEPAVAFRLALDFLSTRYNGKELQKRIIVITEEKESALSKTAENQGYTKFPIPVSVGGRYSILTAVGMLPLALAKYPVFEIMQGAHSLFEALDGFSIGKDFSEKNHPALDVLLLAAVRKAAWEDGIRVDVLACSDSKLVALSEWWKQLFGESEGKENKGLFPTSVIYPTDLHSLGQYLQQGFPSMMETFLTIKSNNDPTFARQVKIPYLQNSKDGIDYLAGKSVLEVNACTVKAARLAHSERGIVCAEITVPQLDAFHLGYLIAFFEAVCAVSGLLLEVNPFDQPGVENYKKKMFQMMGKPGT